jgi:hypothetical protein
VLISLYNEFRECLRSSTRAIIGGARSFCASVFVWGEWIQFCFNRLNVDRDKVSLTQRYQPPERVLLGLTKCERSTRVQEMNHVRRLIAVGLHVKAVVLANSTILVARTSANMRSQNSKAVRSHQFNPIPPILMHINMNQHPALDRDHSV